MQKLLLRLYFVLREQRKVESGHFSKALEAGAPEA